MRIGQGYDVHRLVGERRLILGGVEIPYEKGLLGHSDADVLVHAVMDALLGAAALGDIGQHFPDTDPAYKGISSIELLKHVGALLEEKGYVVENIDATIIAQRPKLAAYRPQMAKNIAEALHLDPGRVSVKATTEEGLGFTGSGEGIASQAITLLTEVADYCYDNRMIQTGCGGCGGCQKNDGAEEFVPLTPGVVKMYVCGPTVYNFIHIGNARPMIVFDTVRRYFEYKGYEVQYVSNFTDVDDKIIKKAIEEGVDADTISKRYIEECKKDMASMNVKPATVHPLATEEICGMLDMIGTLIEKGHAYAAADGTVYFRTGSFKEYGKLSHKNLEDLQSGFREIKVTGEEGKEDPADFVLWKPKKDGEPFWESPWCQGRPGWHIECSVMSKKYLGEQIDIHAGGEDLIFPHHENEIAQSESANDKPFATYWMHNAFLNIDNRKMSKSLGNFFTVREIGEKYDLQVLRFFMLSAHYRSPLNFSADLMEASKNGLERIITCMEKLRDLESKASGNAETCDEQNSMAQADALRGKYEAAMDDDFNTADAISAVFELVKLANSTADADSTARYVSYLKDMIQELCDVLGIITERKAETLDSQVEELIAARQQARKEKNFALADEIRGKLLDMGIVLEDTREGVKWKRV